MSKTPYLRSGAGFRAKDYSRFGLADSVVMEKNYKGQKYEPDEEARLKTLLSENLKVLDEISDKRVKFLTACAVMKSADYQKCIVSDNGELVELAAQYAEKYAKMLEIRMNIIMKLCRSVKRLKKSTNTT